MAWFGEGLSSLKGQITNFTKEVLSEGRDINADASELTATQRIQELESLCASQEFEISALQRRIEELLGDLAGRRPEQRQSKIQELSEWDDVSFREDVGFQSQALNGVGSLFGPSPELQEKELALQVLKGELEALKTENYHVKESRAGLEQQVDRLSRQVKALTSGQTWVCQDLQDVSPNNLGEKLQASELRVTELEKELERVQQQLVEQLGSSQVMTSEIRGDVEQVRAQLGQDCVANKTELLRARQDMVNRIIQMGEKSREVEQNIRQLQQDGKHVGSDISAAIRRLGDPEQQELIHGALKALELENQILRIRNSQLEGLVVSDNFRGGSNRLEHGSVNIPLSGAENNDNPSETSSKHEGEQETVSLKSEISQLSLHKQHLDIQVFQLQNQVEVYEMMKCDWLMEKQTLENNLSKLKEQLKEKETNLSLITARKGLQDLEKQPVDDENKASVDHQPSTAPRDKQTFSELQPCEKPGAGIFHFTTSNSQPSASCRGHCAGFQSGGTGQSRHRWSIRGQQLVPQPHASCCFRLAQYSGNPTAPSLLSWSSWSTTRSKG